MITNGPCIFGSHQVAANWSATILSVIPCRIEDYSFVNFEPIQKEVGTDEQDAIPWREAWLPRARYGSPTTALGVRRDKAALSSGCKSHPATAPAGSSRSSYGGDEIAEAFGKRVTNW